MTAIEVSAAEKWQERFMSQIESMHLQWAVIGEMVHECKSNQYFRALGFQSFEAWYQANKERIGRSRVIIFESRKMFKELSESSVPAKEMRLISRINAKKLLMIPVNHRADPEVLREAKAFSEKQFSESMSRKYGQWMPKDPKMRWGVQTVESRAAKIQEEIEAAMSTYGIESPAEVLEYALVHFNECRVAMSHGYGEGEDGD